jgi:hypothetical protein
MRRREASRGGESASRIPWECEGGIVSATVVHVEEKLLLGIEYGGFGREGFAGVFSRRVRVI